jgi:hypothetical protein
LVLAHPQQRQQETLRMVVLQVWVNCLVAVVVVVAVVVLLPRLRLVLQVDKH